MCEINRRIEDLQPPPPPPPPPVLTKEEFKLNPKALNTKEPTKVNDNEVELLVKRFLDGNFGVFYLTNTNLTPQLQDGPKCGLVALSIATSQRGNSVNVEEIFETAVLNGMTRQGEMFCTNSMAVLAEKYNFKTHIITGGLNAHLNCILKSLERKCLLLVPYDADFNHSPCCKKGWKAHWAVITGFVIFVEGNSHVEDEKFVLVNSTTHPTLCKCFSDAEPSLRISVHQDGILIGKDDLKGTDGCIKKGKIYLIGLQGKSRHLGLWAFDDMSESNNNLISFPEESGFVFPKGGIVEGLKGKAVILENCS